MRVYPRATSVSKKLGIPITLEKRREYRELLVTAPDIEKYISGYILLMKLFDSLQKMEKVLFLLCKERV